ncbi:hypothetical protein O0L34_g15523 [Tuta absoluta]|nr:hypothetical protein O0L34_g15523 [Tuta absoluta]
MKLTLSFFVVILAVVNCKHTFMGTNVQRPLLEHKVIKYSANVITKRIEKFHYTVPQKHFGQVIQGILAYDQTNTGASANVTNGGLGANTVTLRMKSDRGKPIHFDVYIYA